MREMRAGSLVSGSFCGDNISLRCRRLLQAFAWTCAVPALVVSANAAGAPAFWRSALYPQDWTPAFEDGQGRFLHDFSYAGYHNGEVSPPDTPPGPVFDAVVGYGADNTGASDATAALQQAIDAAESAGGGQVFLPAGLYRCDGTLTVHQSNIVLRGEGEFQTKAYFTTFAGMGFKAHLTFAGTVSQGADIPLAEDGQNRSSIVRVADASSLAVGDDIAIGWVITDEFVEEHGMTGVWVTFNGLWKPFFRRKVVAVDTLTTPHEITVDVPLRYPAKMRDQASLRKETGYLEECGVEHLSVANAVTFADAWTEESVHAISFQSVKDCWIRHVASLRF